MQTEVCRSLVEVEARQIITPLSGLRLTPVASLMSIPRRAERPSVPHRPIQPRPTNVQRIVIRTADPEDWARSRRELLRRKFEQRPSRERLVTQHILLSDGRVSPLIEQQARALRQNRIKNCLSRKLGQRPGPLELVTRKILQVDAELENAIQEGRLLFTPTTENDLQEVEEPPTPITTDMEVIATVKQPPKSLNSLTNKGILRKPTKPNPYKPFEQAAARAKTKTADSRLETLDDGPVRTNQIPRVDEHNNYELRLQQQQLFLQWQNEGGVDSLPSSETTLIDQGSSTPTSNGVQMPRKLSDLKVQELKNECKKRQLPVSGPKPQLLERLRGFEKDILGATPPPSPPIQKEDHAFVDLSDKSTDSHMMPHCNGVSRQCSPPEIIFQSETPMRSQHQQKEYVQSPQQMRIQQLVPVQGNGSQLVQLVDERGNVLGMGTVQFQPDSGSQAVVLQQRIVGQLPPQQQVDHHSVTIASQPRILHSAPTPQLQKQQDGTYCFAQMGSGGHFTAVQPNEIVVENNQHKLSNDQSPPMILNTVMAPPVQRVVTSNKKQANIPHAQPAGQGLMSPQVVVTFGQKCQAVQEIQRPQQLTGNRLSSPKLQGSPRIADHPECSPSMPMSESRGTDSCTPMEMIKTKDETITLDPNDPASVLTPKTLQMHEDMLRKQHKMIQALEQEITAAQEMLRKRQQIILAAKKTQQKLRERQRVETEEDTTWVNNMDIRNMNKSHIQSFLQHKNHINKLTSISKEHNRLKTTEERLQEELHVDQAVHDIVRLIKQDPRTALLIVQLLRKYQLERTHTDVVANTSEQTEEEVIEMSSIETLNKQLDSVQSDISGRKSSFGSDTSTSSSLSHCSQEILMSDGTKRLLPGQQLHHTNTVYYAEPMDDKPDMEAVFKSVIDNASRLTSDGHMTPEQNIDCTVSAVMDSPKQTSGQLQWNSMARQTVYVVQNQNIDHPNHEFKTPRVVVQRSQTQKPNFAVVQQMQLVQQQEKSDMDAYGDSFNEADFNPTLDDVMAVVQADTDFSSGGEPFSGGEYGSEALAQFLGEDWLNMANQSISHDGQYVPYNQDESGRSTDPMSMGMPMDTNEHDWLDEFLIREPVDT